MKEAKREYGKRYYAERSTQVRNNIMMARGAEHPGNEHDFFFFFCFCKLYFRERYNNNNINIQL